MRLRHHHPDADADRPQTSGGCSPRLNLLLAREGREDLDRVGRVLEPLGIRSIETTTGEEAADVIRSQPVHIALIDWDVPLRSDGGGGNTSGARLLQLLRRLDPAPPTIVVRPRQAVSRERVRGLHDALREGAFAVLDRPVDREVLLEIFRRVLLRHYRGCWPH